MRTYLFPAVLACAAQLLTSCGLDSKVGDRLSGYSAEQRAAFKAYYEGVDQVPAKPISWSEAYTRLAENNLSLRQSAIQLEKARDLKWEEWKRLVPRVNSYVNIGASFAELSDLGGDDLNARLIANLSIPNPFRLYASLYSAALQRQNAEWSHQLDKRRAFVELYRAFLDARSIIESRDELREREARLLDLNDGEIASALVEIRREKETIKRRQSYLRVRLNQLLNTPGAHWQPAGTLPKISFRDKLDRVRIGENFGKLALNLQAVRIEGGWLQMRRVKFRQWPQVNFSMGLPPIYSNTDNQGFNSEEILIFSGATKQVDLTDIAGLEDVEDARRRLQFLRERLEISVEREAQRVHQLSASYRDLLAEKQRQQAQLTMLDRHRGSSAAETVLADLEQRGDLQRELRKIEDQIRQLDLQFIIWDETFWKP